MLAEHASNFGQLADWAGASWLVVIALSFGFGARVFHHMAYMPPDLRKGPWYLVAYGLTGYAVCRLGWLFDSLEVVESFWLPLIQLTTGIVLVGGILVLERAGPRLELHVLPDPDEIPPLKRG